MCVTTKATFDSTCFALCLCRPPPLPHLIPLTYHKHHSLTTSLPNKQPATPNATITTMKLFVAVAATVLLRNANPGEAAAPRLRINTDVVQTTSDDAAESESKRTASASSGEVSSRERISNYVETGQVFFILDSSTDAVPMIYEDPSKDPIFVSGVFWLCQPTTAPDLNGDGMYDSVVSRANYFYPPKVGGKGITQPGATGATSNKNTGLGFFSTHGYTASWVKDGEYYNERIVDFGDTTVFDIHGKVFVGYETSPPGTSGGLVICEYRNSICAYTSLTTHVHILHHHIFFFYHFKMIKKTHLVQSIHSSSFYSWRGTLDYQHFASIVATNG